MKQVLLAAAALALSACAEGYGYGPHGGGYGGGDVAYYDNSYGAIYDGYWGGDGAYYYAPARGQPFVRDEGHHFRRDHADGYHSFRGHGGHHDDGARDHDHDHDGR
jgi:hypothetical protein